MHGRMRIEAHQYVCGVGLCLFLGDTKEDINVKKCKTNVIEMDPPKSGCKINAKIIQKI